MKKLTAIDCFSGAGGLSLGLSQAGFQLSWAFDSSQKAIDTHNRNLGNHAVCLKAEDLTSDRLAKLKDQIGECTLVAGGPPCQGFSRQRRGADLDPRNDLVNVFFSIVKYLNPQFFLLENVPALQGPRGKPYLEALHRSAEESGYIVHTSILNAADFGVAQVRRRFFAVGERSVGLSNYEFPKPLVTSANYKTVREAIGNLPDPAVSVQGLPANHEIGNVSPLNIRRISYVPQGGGREFIPDELKLKCHRVSVEVAGHRNVYGRLTWDRPANTITTKCNSFTRGMFAHPSADRNITMREAARLQGFPDDFVFSGSRVDVAHQVGNAVPPPLAQAMGKSILSALLQANKASSRRLKS